jgi:hypothetical protein
MISEPSQAETPRIEKQVDSAHFWQRVKSWVGDRLSPVTSSDNYLTDERDPDPTKLRVILAVGGGGLLLVGITGGIAARIAASKMQEPTKRLEQAVAPAQQRTPPTAAKILPLPMPTPTKSTGVPRTITPAQASTPRPPAPLPYVSQEYRRSGLSDPRQLRQEAKRQAWEEVSRRGIARDPLTGSVLKMANLPPGSEVPPAPNSNGAIPQLPRPPVSYGRQSYQPGIASDIPSAQPENIGGLPTQFSRNYPNVQPQQGPEVQGYQSNLPGSNPTAQLAQYSAPPTFPLRVQTSNFNVIPRGQLIRATLRSEIRVLQSPGAQSETPVIAQVDGAVRVDGQEVIPSGALLLGRVIAAEPGLSRVRIDFYALQFGSTTIPLRGAYAWSVSGNAALSEGLVAEVSGTPNYLASDLMSAGGGALSTFSRTLGQQVTYGNNNTLGTPYSSTYSSGDFETAAQRALSQGASDFLTRQVRRSDQSTSRLESRGAILRVPPATSFVVYLTQGI